MVLLKVLIVVTHGDNEGRVWMSLQGKLEDREGQMACVVVFVRQFEISLILRFPGQCANECGGFSVGQSLPAVR